MVFDGYSVAYSGHENCDLAHLLDARRAFVQTYPDRDLKIVLGPDWRQHFAKRADQDEIQRLRKTGEVILALSGVRGSDDAAVLSIARDAQATVVSNDGFEDYPEHHEWLAQQGRLFGAIYAWDWLFQPRRPTARTPGRSRPSSTV